MSETRTRAPFVALATILFVLTSSGLSPSSSQDVEPVSAPDPQQIRLLEELVEWLSGHPAGDQDFHLLADGDLVGAIRSRAQSFELFRRFNGTEANRKLLEGVPYGGAIYRAARRHRLDSLLLAAVVEAESNFNPRVTSPAGAVGLAQVMPHTGGSFSAEDLRNPEVNLEIGARYLSRMLDRYQGDLELALAAYNAGPGNVSRYGGVPPFRETRTYVRKVLGIYVDLHRHVWRATGAGHELLGLSPPVRPALVAGGGPAPAQAG